MAATPGRRSSSPRSRWGDSDHLDSCAAPRPTRCSGARRCAYRRSKSCPDRRAAAASALPLRPLPGQRCVRSPGGTRRCQHDWFPVVRPALSDIVTRAPRQTLRLSAFTRNHVHVGVAGILGSECDRSAVRRKLRIRRLPLKTGQPPSRSARPLHRPEIARVSKGDVCRADGRRPRQPRKTEVEREGPSASRAPFAG